MELPTEKPGNEWIQIGQAINDVLTVELKEITKV